MEYPPATVGRVVEAVYEVAPVPAYVYTTESTESLFAKPLTEMLWPRAVP